MSLPEPLKFQPKMRHCKHYAKAALFVLCSVIVAWYIMIKTVHPCSVPVPLLMPKVMYDNRHEKICTRNDKDSSFHMEPADPHSQPLDHHYLMLADERGQMGNLMFQVASAFGFAHALRYKTYIESSHPLAPYFDLQTTKRMTVTNVLELNEAECRSAVWKCHKDVLSHNLTLRGWFQSWKYFLDISPTVREIFTIKTVYFDQAKEFLTLNIHEDRIVIGIHVRRGDKLSAMDRACGNIVASVGYINKAMELFREQYNNAFFVVVSDDIKWCRENIVARDVIFSDFKEPVIDLAIMTLCDHMIITVGTFGWWGAWLGRGGKVIYLKDFPLVGSWLDAFGMYKEDYYPLDWVGLSNFAMRLAPNTYNITMILTLVLHSVILYMSSAFL